MTDLTDNPSGKITSEPRKKKRPLTNAGLKCDPKKLIRPTFLLIVAGQKVNLWYTRVAFYGTNPFPKVLMSSFRVHGSWEIEIEIEMLA